MSNLYGNDGASANAKIGFQIGGMLEYSFSESMALQPELLYVLNGASFDDETVESMRLTKPSMSLHNIQLPVNFKYKFGVENLKFYATAGPYIGYLASAKMKTTVNGIDMSFDLFDKIAGYPSELKHFDFGLGVGFGVELSKITLGVGYQHGLMNLSKVSNAPLKSSTFNLSVGYFF